MDTKIEKTTRGIIILLGVLKVLCIIAMAIELVAQLWYIFSSSDASSSISSVPILENSLKILTPSGDLSSPLPANLSVDLIMALIHQGLILSVLFIASSIFRIIQKSHSPFVEGVSRKMKRISVLLVIAAVFSAGFLMSVIIAGICFCFAIIFDYGCVLQRRDDETL